MLYPINSFRDTHLFSSVSSQLSSLMAPHTQMLSFKGWYTAASPQLNKLYGPGRGHTSKLWIWGSWISELEMLSNYTLESTYWLDNSAIHSISRFSGSCADLQNAEYGYYKLNRNPALHALLIIYGVCTDSI